MINTKAGAKDFAIPWPDVKLGPGGIREIEFFVQTQQLILGGRRPELRDNTTLGAMEALRAGGVVNDETARALSEAYRQLRNVEHRIQMRHDEQTHTVPKDPAEREAVARLCGYDSLEAFDRDLLRRAAGCRRPMMRCLPRKTAPLAKAVWATSSSRASMTIRHGRNAERARLQRSQRRHRHDPQLAPRPGSGDADRAGP
ncbi:MAG: hypothetical protein R3C08_13825 [Hyphomonas sp.]